MAKQVERATDLLGRITAPLQPGAQHLFLDVPVGAVSPVT
jgi:hypothetical protein